MVVTIIDRWIDAKENKTYNNNKMVLLVIKSNPDKL